jgi:hypothetical protein
MRWCGDLEQAVVGAVLRMLAARAGCDAQCGLAPLHAKRQGFGRNDQVIYLSFHGQ